MALGLSVVHRHTWLNDRIRYLGAAGYANINMDIYHEFDNIPVK